MLEVSGKDIPAALCESVSCCRPVHGGRHPADLGCQDTLRNASSVLLVELDPLCVLSQVTCPGPPGGGQHPGQGSGNSQSAMSLQLLLVHSSTEMHGPNFTTHSFTEGTPAPSAKMSQKTRIPSSLTLPQSQAELPFCSFLGTFHLMKSHHDLSLCY